MRVERFCISVVLTWIHCCVCLWSVQVRSTTPFAKVMAAYARHVHADLEAVRFVFDGQALRPDQTPADVSADEQEKAHTGARAQNRIHTVSSLLSSSRGILFGYSFLLCACFPLCCV